MYRRLVGDGFRAFRTVTVTVRFTGFVTVSRSYTGQDSASELEQLQAAVQRQRQPFFDARENPKRKKIPLSRRRERDGPLAPAAEVRAGT